MLPKLAYERLSIHARLLIAAISVALAGYYLSAWMHMPIYPDETATRLQSFRAIADHGLRYVAFPYCAGSSPTPIPMLPFAYLLGALDSFAGWSFVRVIPLVSLLAVFAAAVLAIQRHAANHMVLLLPLAFVGVTGSGLIMMRPECFLALQGAAIFAGYWLIRNQRNNLLDASWIVGTTFVSLLSIYTHPQGIILFPISLTMTVWLVVKSASRTVQALGCLAILWTAVGSFTMVPIFSPACSEHPVFQKTLYDLSIFGPKAWPEFSSSLSPWIEKFQKHTDNFLFKEDYIAGYLPAFSHAHVLSLRWLNTSISVAVGLNLALTLIVIGWASIKSVRILFQSEDPIGVRLASFFAAGSTFLAIGASAMFALLLVDHYTLFYRSHCVHMALVLINVVALSSLKLRWHASLVPLYCFAIALCLQSTVTTFKYIDSMFLRGWQGPSLSLSTDWNAVSAKVSRLTKTCGIAKSQERIVIDDLTYTALREHTHLLPLSYMWVEQSVIEPGTQPMSPVRRLGTALLVRCQANFGPNIPEGVIRDGDLCCANFE